jgi:hypothetical protein
LCIHWHSDYPTVGIIAPSLGRPVGRAQAGDWPTVTLSISSEVRSNLTRELIPLLSKSWLSSNGTSPLPQFPLQVGQHELDGWCLHLSSCKHDENRIVHGCPEAFLCHFDILGHQIDVVEFSDALFYVQSLNKPQTASQSPFGAVKLVRPVSFVTDDNDSRFISFVTDDNDSRVA